MAMATTTASTIDEATAWGAAKGAGWTAPSELAELTRAIDGLVAAAPLSLAGGESVIALTRQLARLESVCASSVATFDATGAWGTDGAKSAVGWITTKTRLARTDVRRLARRGRGMSQIRSFGRAWEQGSVSGAHLDAVMAVRRPSTEATLEEHEGMLLKHAHRLRFEDFCRVVSYWDNAADPDGTEEAAEARRERRDVFLSPSFNGMYLGKMTFDSISGVIVANELERLEKDLFTADWEQAKAELGTDPKVSQLCRTSAQRRADAMVEMATRSGVAPADGRRPAPLFSVLVGYETLAGPILELANKIVLTPGSLLPWLEEADIERAVFEPGGRVEVSATARFFTGGLRRAIELRDRECQHPSCDVPSHLCQCDHVVPYSEGGLTNQENGRMLCGFHNRARNHERPPPEE
jgi:hypothetical protein